MRAFCKPCWKIRRNNRPLRQQGPVTDGKPTSGVSSAGRFFGSVPLSFGGKGGGGGGPLVLALRNAVETHSDARTRRHCLDVSVGSAIIFWCFFGKRKKFRAFCGNVGPNLVYYDYMEWSRAAWLRPKTRAAARRGHASAGGVPRRRTTCTNPPTRPSRTGAPCGRP